MSRNALLLVRNSSASLVLSLTDKSTRLPLDVSSANLTVRLRVRQEGAGSAAGDVVCTKLTGRLLLDGSIDTAVPYDVAGAGGRVQADVPGSYFSAAGNWQAEVRVEDGTTGDLVIPHDLVRITVREGL